MRAISIASLKRLLLIAVVAGAPAHAAALACGTILYGPVTLTADVVCRSGADGLIVGDHKVRIVSSAPYPGGEAWSVTAWTAVDAPDGEAVTAYAMCLTLN